MCKIIHLSLVLIAFCSCSLAQNTIGLISINETHADGFNLIYPNSQSAVFLIDYCGELINEWNGQEGSTPGAMAQLLNDGSILKASNNEDLLIQSFGSGGKGGLLEILDWDGNIKWQYILADSIYRQHHEVQMMPNGNVLIIAWQKHFLNDVVENGFDTLSFLQRELWSESIIEIDTATNDIVWQWDSWDHLVQDIDPQKSNYGIVQNEWNKININYQEFSFGNPDFMHFNSIDYNPLLDQIMISNRNYNEIWIIDHSISTSEAKTNLGDLLFRWGNKRAYGISDQGARQCFYQHDAHWVDDFVETTNSFYGQVAFYNNTVDLNLSLGQIIAPVWNVELREYERNAIQYNPLDYSATFSHPDTIKNFSSNASSIQILPNENILMMAAQKGRAFELNSEGNLVWEYVVPMRNGFPVDQGEEITLNQNFTFQMKFYPKNYSAFLDKDLSPKGYLELMPNEMFCSQSLSSDNTEIDFNAIQLYPNPNNGTFQINSPLKMKIDLVDMFGRKVDSLNLEKGMNSFTFSFKTGIYYLSRNGSVLNKLVILN